MGLEISPGKREVTALILNINIILFTHHILLWFNVLTFICMSSLNDFFFSYLIHVTH